MLMLSICALIRSVLQARGRRWKPSCSADAGTITAATIYGVNANGTVNLVWFGSGGATSATSVGYDPNLGTGKWAYPQFQ